LSCMVCCGGTSHAQGIVCANYGYTRGPWSPCRGAWHARCYQVPHRDPFPIGLGPKDLDGSTGDLEFTGEEEKDREDEFWGARAGDHLMLPFQCEVCHFVNISHSEPDYGFYQDLWTLQVMSQVVDSFWSRRPGTIKGNLKEARLALVKAGMHGWDRPLRTTPRGLGPARILVEWLWL
jgi:hypothetical protein